jgi:hypothetical protein
VFFFSPSRKKFTIFSFHTHTNSSLDWRKTRNPLSGQQVWQSIFDLSYTSIYVSVHKHRYQKPYIHLPQHPKDWRCVL